MFLIILDTGICPDIISEIYGFVLYLNNVYSPVKIVFALQVIFVITNESIILFTYYAAAYRTYFS